MSYAWWRYTAIQDKPNTFTTKNTCSLGAKYTLNLDKFDNLKEYKELIKYIEELYDPKKNNYIMIDEVQMCNGFEKAINNFYAGDLLVQKD